MERAATHWKRSVTIDDIVVTMYANVQCPFRKTWSQRCGYPNHRQSRCVTAFVSHNFPKWCPLRTVSQPLKHYDAHKLYTGNWWHVYNCHNKAAECMKNGR